MESKKGIRREEWGFMAAIVLGLMLGIAIKKIRIGLLIGVVLGIMFLLSTWIRLFRGKK